MRREDAIRANQDAMNALARLSEEIHELDWLIMRYGQARWFNPEKVRRLSRTKERLLDERDRLVAEVRHTRQFI